MPKPTATSLWTLPLGPASTTSNRPDAMLPEEPIEEARIKAETPIAPRAEAANESTAEPLPPRRPSVRLMLSHPAHLISLGFGSGLSPVAPGTAGTLWAWLTFVLGSQWLTPVGWGIVLALGLPIGWWACTRTAQALGTADPSAVVWDEILAFWAVLWLVMPAGWLTQIAAFGLF